MTPTEFKKFASENQKAFFAKYPKPSRSGPRGFWKQSVQHANNALEDNDWQAETFSKAAAQIQKMMS